MPFGQRGSDRSSPGRRETRGPREPREAYEPPTDGSVEVTSLAPSRRDVTRAVVKVSGKAVGTVASSRLDGLGLRVGATWTAELAERVREAARFDAAMRDASSRLNRRPWSRARLAGKLRERGHDAPVIEAVLDRLVELGALDDEAYARAVIRETVRAKPAGASLLEARLRQRGIDAALARKLTAEHVAEREQANDGQPDAELLRLAESRLRAMRRLPVETRLRRLWGQLARRGFNADAIRDVVDQLKAQGELTGDDEDEDGDGRDVVD